MEWLELAVALMCAVMMVIGIRLLFPDKAPICEHSPCRLGIGEHPLSLGGASVGASTSEGRVELAGEVRVCEKCGALYLLKAYRPAAREEPVRYDGI